MNRLSLVACVTLLQAIALARGGELPAVALPPGETALDDLGLYQVGYQSYGDQPVLFPLSWSGHFEAESGVSYVPNGSVAGRRALLLHSPWRVPAGKAWVDYRLRLPAVKPITFAGGLAMGAEYVIPGRSDGVTFSAEVIQGDQTRALFRQHYASAQWQDFSFDLSPLAGQEIILRLQTEPGPQNNPSWDYSYFGNARLTAGNVSDSRQERLRALLESKAYRATAGVSLARLANRGDQGVTPSNLLDAKTSLEREGDDFRFIYEAADARIVYHYRPQAGTLDDLTVQVDGGPVLQPAAGGGVFSPGSGPDERARRLAGGSLTRPTPEPEAARLRFIWEYPVEGRTVPVAWEFRLRDKALEIAATCQEPILSLFSLGHLGQAPLRRSLAIPYLPPVWEQGAVDYLPSLHLFACRYLDWTHSQASRAPQGEAFYHTRTDGVRHPLHETGYVAVSPNVNEVLPNIPHPPSPYLKLLGDRIVLDIWGHRDNTFRGDAANLRELKDNGVDHLALIQHVWQRWGYDVKLPDHIPANPNYGGEAGMIEFGQAAKAAGYLWAAHENYIDLYPDAPSYDPAARVLLANGEPSKAWYNPGTKVQSFGLKCNRALGFAQQNSPFIHRTYQTTAGYLDVHTCVPPWHQLDHEAGQPGAAQALTKVKHDGELFQYMRDTHRGPLFGEGANHFYWAGRCDGVEAQVSGGAGHRPFLDLDLLKLHPQMVNHGMGYYERWFPKGYQHTWGLDTGTPEQVDQYRAQELAYGHAGFVSSPQTANIGWVAREHHLMHPVQALYGTALVKEISYEVDGKLVSGSVALALDQRTRQRIKYASGLTLWVNWDPRPWRVAGKTLPQWGYLAQGPGTTVSLTLEDGQFADYAECPAYVFADARTAFPMPYRQERRAIEPRLKDFAYLGGDKIRMTYEWTIDEGLKADYNCFVHFLNEDHDSIYSEHIVFQNDHPLPTPTSQWRKGQVLVDGPHEVTVSPQYDRYLIAVGLFKPERVRLRGPLLAHNKVLVGVLQVTRQDGQITDVRLGDLAAASEKNAIPEADFTAHTNPPGTMLDFGKLATDGAVKVNLGQSSLTVFPYPREKQFGVTLDLRRLRPGQRFDTRQLRVQAQAAGTRADLGALKYSLRNGKLTFQVGRQGAGRYVVSW